MHRLLAAIFVVLSFTLPAIGYSQTASPVWFTLNAPEGSVVTATGPITLRYGQVASTCAVVVSSGPCSGVSVGAPSPEAWTSPQTFSPPPGSSTVTVTVSNATFGDDPIPGVYKTVQVQELATAQTITVNGQSVTVPTLPGSSSASSWFTLNAPEGSVVTATGPITLRYGQVASTCAVVVSSGPCSGVSVGAPSPEAWTSPQTFSPPPGSSTVNVTVSTATFGVDPIPGVYKTVQIQELDTAQTITVNGQSVTVPALSGSSSTSSSWFTLNAPEGSVVTATGPITLRYGQVASTCAVVVSSGPCSGVSVGAPSPEAWTSPQTFSPPPGSSTVTVTVSNATFGTDPIPGVYKTVQVQELATAQTITVNGQSVTVPAISGTSSCQLVASPAVINFQNTTVGYTYSSPASLVSNCPSTITISAAQISGPYSTSGFQTPFSLASGQTINYTVVFAPTSVGTVNGTINFVNNATSNVSVTLTGTGVAATSLPSHYVALSWNASGSQVSGYNVYRSSVSGQSYSKINTSLTSGPSYTDQSVAVGTTYYYVVTAVSTDGTESAYSNQATAVVPSP